MYIAPIDTSTKAPLRAAAAVRLRGAVAESRAVLEQDATILRLSPVARRLGSDYVDPLRSRGQPADAPPYAGSPSHRSDEEAEARTAIQQAFERPFEPENSRSLAGRQDDPYSRRDLQPPLSDGPAQSRLSDEDKRVIEQLLRRDREVRAHEAAHVAAAGGLAGAPRFDTTIGPDGRRYVTGGEVPISMAPGGTPEETIARMTRVQQAALAPVSPSGQDMSVASRAARMVAAARLELARRDAEIERMDEGPDSFFPGAEAQDVGAPSSAPYGGQEETTEMATTSARGSRTSLMRYIDEQVKRVEITRRNGGVAGGHIHTSLRCGFCEDGLRAYTSGVF